MTTVKTKDPETVSMTRGELDNIIADKIKKNQTITLIAIGVIAVAAYFAGNKLGPDSFVTVFLNDLQTALVTTDGVSSTSVVSGTLTVPAGSTISLTEVE